MKTKSISKRATHIIDEYRFTFHFMFEGRSGLIEIERFHYKKTFLGRMTYWKRIYFGHIDPIKQAVEFFDQNINSNQR